LWAWILYEGIGFCGWSDGKVIGVDKSNSYIEYLNELARLHHLNIETIHADFKEMTLADNSLDGIYCRWALAWLPNPKEILQKVHKALKPKGRMVFHEYYDWSTHQTEPSFDTLTKAIDTALKSFKESDGEIDIGRELPRIVEELDMKIVNILPYFSRFSKIAFCLNQQKNGNS